MRIILLFLASIGFADALYLTISHYTSSGVCPVGDTCAIVTESSYATIGPVPVALIGAFYYAAVLFAASWAFSRPESRGSVALASLTAAGFLASLYFVSIQLFVLEAICFYCMVSAGTSTALCAASLWHWRHGARKPAAALTS